MSISFATALSHVQQAARGNLKDLGKVLRALVEGTINTIVMVTDAALTLTAEKHRGMTMVLNRADGTTVTLPAATGSGDKYTFVVGESITSNAAVIQAASADDIFAGAAFVAQDGGNGAQAFEAFGGHDTISMNGSTTGGTRGDRIEFIDMLEGVWGIQAQLASTGTESSPFQNAVS